MLKIAMMLAAALSFASPTLASPTPGPRIGDDTEYVPEAVGDFDRQDVHSFLLFLSDRLPGFTREQAKHLGDEVISLDQEEGGYLRKEYLVSVDGRKQWIVVNVYADEYSYAISFRAVAETADFVQERIAEFGQPEDPDVRSVPRSR